MNAPTNTERKLTQMKDEHKTAKPILAALLNASESLAPAQARHSSLPWDYDGGESCEITAVTDHKNASGHTCVQLIAIATERADINDGQDGIAPRSPEEAKANAAYIVRACNNAQRLADALSEVLTFVGHKPSCRGGGYGVQPCDCGAQAVVPKAREALTEWSKAQ